MQTLNSLKEIYPMLNDKLIYVKSDRHNPNKFENVQLWRANEPIFFNPTENKIELNAAQPLKTIERIANYNNLRNYFSTASKRSFFNFNSKGSPLSG